MRTTCRRCKKGSLQLIQDYSQAETTTTVENVSSSRVGFFDADGQVDGWDHEERSRDEADTETEVGDEECDRTYVACERCGWVDVDHPLSEIAAHEADEMNARRANARPVRVVGKAVA